MKPLQISLKIHNTALINAQVYVSFQCLQTLPAHIFSRHGENDWIKKLITAIYPQRSFVNLTSDNKMFKFLLL